MDDVARLPAADRADLFVVTGTGRGLTSEMIEKDSGSAGHSSDCSPCQTRPQNCSSRAAPRFPRHSRSSSGFRKTWICRSTGPGWDSAGKASVQRYHGNGRKHGLKG